MVKIAVRTILTANRLCRTAGEALLRSLCGVGAGLGDGAIVLRFDEREDLGILRAGDGREAADADRLRQTGSLIGAMQVSGWFDGSGRHRVLNCLARNSAERGSILQSLWIAT
jgi:hypothetical protein